MLHVSMLICMLIGPGWELRSQPHGTEIKGTLTYVISCPFKALSLVFIAPWTDAKHVPIPRAIIQWR